jgi:DNA-binding Xre family transcriptional regulator
MIRLRIAEVLTDKGISKSEFARLMGIQKQNVNALLETNNIRKIEEIADKLGVKFSDLIDDGNVDSQPEITGYIEFKGEVFRIKSKADIEELLKRIE